MVKRKKLLKSDVNIYKSIFIGLIIGVVVILLGSASTTYLILKNTITPDAVTWVSIVILFAASYIGALISSKLAGDKRLMNLAIIVLVMFMLILTTGMLFFDGLSINAWRSVLGIAAGVGLNFVIGLLPKRKKHYAKIRHG